MSININTWPYFAFILTLLLLAGMGEYVHIVPGGTFGSLLLVAIGLIAPSPLVHAAAPVSTPPASTPPTPTAGA